MKKTGTRNADLEAIDEILDMARQATGKMVEKRSPKATPAVVAEAEAEDEVREAIEEEVVDDTPDAGALLQGKKDAALAHEEPAPGDDAWVSAALRKYLDKNKK